MTVFSVGGINHVRLLMGTGASGSLNAGSVLPDLIVPALLVALFVARHYVVRRQPAGQVQPRLGSDHPA